MEKNKKRNNRGKEKVITRKEKRKIRKNLGGER